jgi:hypothetical protein
MRWRKEEIIIRLILSLGDQLKKALLHSLSYVEAELPAYQLSALPWIHASAENHSVLQ